MADDDFALSADDVAEIAAILEGSHWHELDLATRRFRLRVRRSGDGTGFTQEWEWAGAAAPAAHAAEAAAADDPDAIPAPLPGTFYHAPQPGAPPFVRPGDTVGPDTVVGIIETMKLMNPVHAGRSGTIAEVVVGNGVMVARGQALIRLA